MSGTIGHEIAKEVAAELDGKHKMVETSVETNHKGAYVEARVPHEQARDDLYDEVNEYPCYIDVVVQ